MDLVKWLRLQWDRAAAIALIAIGALALLLGWIGVSGHAYLATQLPYIISGGVGGLFLLGLGAMLWLSSDLRDEWQKLDRIERQLAASPLLLEQMYQQPDAVPAAGDGHRPTPGLGVATAGDATGVIGSSATTRSAQP